jgi:hypothetical protein
MKRVWLVGIVAGLAGVGCTTQQDSGVVMGCFGLVNQNVPGQDVVSSQVLTNLYFGGCAPSDNTGMQILERVTPEGAADQAMLTSLCDQDCGKRIAAYAAVHPGIPTGSLSCQTLFASQCPGIGADVGSMSGDTGQFQAGGPADQRFLLNGTITVTINNQAAPPIPANGLVDATLGPCQGAGMNCPVTVSRLDVVANSAFVLAGVAFDTAEVQNQGIGTGSRQAGNMLINPMELELSALEDATQQTTQFHLQTQTLNKNAQNLTLTQFFSSFSLTTTPVTQNGVTVQVTVQMTGQPFGSPPVVGMAPSTDNTKYECTCAECTTVSFASTATDPDNDLQSLAWLLDNNLQGADGTSAPPELDLQLALSPIPANNLHTVSLVATDTRGATSMSSHTFSIADTTPPTITPPPALTIRSCDFPYLGQATATDICSGKAAITNNSPGAFPVGTTVVTWSAEDASGNIGTATQKVTVTQAAQTACCPAGAKIIDGTKMQQGSDGFTHIDGTPGPDCIIGTQNNDKINGMGGDDIIFGNGGQDQIIGGPGNDTIFVGNGTNTTVEGDDGDDRILGGATQDHITGGLGNDIIMGGGGDDVIDGGDGDDFIYGNAGNDTITGGNGIDLLDGGDGIDHITCGDGNDTVSGGVGLNGNDVITCNNGDNFIAGFAGDDHLTGGTGNDTVFGGGGHNTCVGGGGMDVIFCSP